MGFGKEIKRLREDANISVKKLSDLIGLGSGGADRWRLWERKDFSPKDEDTRLIEAFFKMPLKEIEKLQSIKKFLNVPRENLVGNVLMDQGIQYGLSHTDKLIKVLEERLTEEKRILEKHNEFLQDIIKSNLAGMKANQNLGAGILVELLQRDVDREVKGNPEKRKKILDEIVRRIGPDFDLVTGMGTMTHDGSANIR